MNSLTSFLAAAALALFGSATTTPQIAPHTSCGTFTKVLQLGSSGEEVKKLQTLLAVQQSGYFGPLTRQKLIDWQVSKKIIVSAQTAGAGTTGPKTRAALKCGDSREPPVVSIVVPVQKAGVATTSIVSTSTSAAPPSSPVPSGSGDGSVVVPSVSPYGYTCGSLGAKPAVSSCTDGTWQLSADEAGCIIWACLSQDDRG